VGRRVRSNQPLALALSTSTTSSGSTTPAVMRSVTILLRQAAMTMAGYLRRSDRAFRIGGDEFAIIMPSTDSERGQLAVRRLLAGCLDGESGRQGIAAGVVLGRHQRHPGHAATATRSTRRPTPRCSGASATAGRA
jgi:hypothetical protein